MMKLSRDKISSNLQFNVLIKPELTPLSRGNITLISNIHDESNPMSTQISHIKYGEYDRDLCLYRSNT